MPTTSVPGYDPYADAPMTSMGIPELWSEEQVIEWLSGIGAAYAKYGAAFKDNGINGKELLGDNFGLEALEELGVTSKLHQNRMLREVAELKQQ